MNSTTAALLLTTRHDVRDVEIERVDDAHARALRYLLRDEPTLIPTVAFDGSPLDIWAPSHSAGWPANFWAHTLLTLMCPEFARRYGPSSGAGIPRGANSQPSPLHGDVILTGGPDDVGGSLPIQPSVRDLAIKLCNSLGRNSLVGE